MVAFCAGLSLSAAKDQGERMITKPCTRRAVLASAVLSTAGAALGVAPAFGQTVDDMTIGEAAARLHLVEYASLTCPHCAQFHADNWDTLRARYIDTGRVRFTLREMATAPAGVAVGMFQLARCGGADAEEYMRRVKILFERQRAILGTGAMIGVRDALLAIGAEWGLSAQQVMAALTDPAGGQRVTRISQSAAALGVNHTPSFLFNRVLNDDHAFLTREGMVRTLDTRLAQL